jgi:hypothetical protein
MDAHKETPMVKHLFDEMETSNRWQMCALNVAIDALGFAEKNRVWDGIFNLSVVDLSAEGIQSYIPMDRECIQKVILALEDMRDRKAKSLSDFRLDRNKP